MPKNINMYVSEYVLLSSVVKLQTSAKVGASCLVNFVPAIAYHSCLKLPAAFSQPGAPPLADLCTHFTPVQGHATSRLASCWFGLKQLDKVKAQHLSYQISIQGEGSNRYHVTDSPSKFDNEVSERFTYLWREIRTLRVRSDFYLGGGKLH